MKSNFFTNKNIPNFIALYYLIVACVSNILLLVYTCDNYQVNPTDSNENIIILLSLLLAGLIIPLCICIGNCEV